MRRVDHPTDEGGAGKRPGGIVHQHDLARGLHEGERIGHRILPPCAAGHDTHRAGPGLRQARRQRIEVRCRQRHDDLVHVGVCRQQRQAALEHRPAVEVDELLRTAGTDTDTEAAGRQDRAHVGTPHAIHRASSWPPTACPTRVAVRSSTRASVEASFDAGA